MKEKILADLKDALKKANREKANVLRLLLNSLSQKQIEKRAMLAKAHPDWDEKKLEIECNLSEEEIFQVIFYEIKKRKEAIEEFKKGKREDLVEKEEKEILILKEYLPPEIPPEKIKEVVEETIREMGTLTRKDFGVILGKVMQKLKGSVDSSTVAKIIKEVLEGKV